MEGSSLSGIAFYPYASAMRLDDPFYDGESQPRARGPVPSRVGSVETFKDAFAVRRRYRHTLVSNAYGGLHAGSPYADFDRGFRLRVFDRIIEELG